MVVKAWNDVQKGVEVRPGLFGNEITICYNGLLAKSGADQIYLHVGFGDNKNWRGVATHKMERTARGWEKTIRMEDAQINFCFKDSANNWDNNNGYNWTARM